AEAVPGLDSGHGAQAVRRPRTLSHDRQRLARSRRRDARVARGDRRSIEPGQSDRHLTAQPTNQGRSRVTRRRPRSPRARAARRRDLVPNRGASHQRPSTLQSQKGSTMTYPKITVRAVRPALLTFLSAVVLLLSFGSVAQASAKSRSTAAKPAVVLVHGGWADGSSWDGVVGRLQRDGYTVDVPSNPLRGVASDSAYLASYLKTVT